MPKTNYSEYPKDWKDISKRIRLERAKGKCEWCGAERYTCVKGYY